MSGVIGFIVKNKT